MNEIKKKALNGELGVKQYHNSSVISNSSLMGDDDDKKAFIGKVMNEFIDSVIYIKRFYYFYIKYIGNTLY